jgi:hypothetical protein
MLMEGRKRMLTPRVDGSRMMEDRVKGKSIFGRVVDFGVVLVCVFGLVVVSETEGATIIVRADGSGDYPTIQAAIDAALTGDTIIIEDGTYAGGGNKNLDFKGSMITVRSANGPESTIIDCENSGRGFNFHSGEGPNSVVSGLTITGGNILAYGGGIHCQGASPTIEDCIITANKAYGSTGWMVGGPALGGGICCRSGSSPLITGCTISNNRAQGGEGVPYEGFPFPGGNGLGGGIYRSSDSSAVVLDCVFIGNRAIGGRGSTGGIAPGDGGHGYGGGLYADSGGPLVVYRCKLLNNAADGGNSGSGYDGSPNGGNGLGGGLYSGAGSVMLRSCTVVGNAARGGSCSGYKCDGIGYGGGVYGGAEIWGCTFVNNSAENQGGGVYGSASVRGSILWDDSAPSYPEVGPSSGPTVAYSDVEGGFAGVGNIDTNPLLEGPADGVYHLSAYSACRDTGDPNYAAEPEETDIDGDARVVRGRIDIGADEFFREEPYMFVLPLDATFVASVGNPTPGAQVVSINNLGSQTLNWQVSPDCSWLTAEPNNGSCDAETDEVFLSVDASGVGLGFHNCTLTVSDPCAENSPQTVSVTVEVYTEGRVEVPEDFATIQAAIDATTDGAEVVVHPNVYTGPGNYYIDFEGKAITVRSIEPENPGIVATTIIEPNTFAVGFYFKSGEGANSVVDGLTIRRCGWAGISCHNSSPTIRNCIIEDNHSSPGGVGAGIGCYGSSVVISNCVIRDNIGGVEGGSGINIWGGQSGGSVTIRNCLISNNQAFGGGGINCFGQDAHVVNCTIVNNRSLSYPWYGEKGSGMGGGILLWNSNVIMRNCIFWNNDANKGAEIAMGYYDGSYPSTATVSYCDVQGGQTAVYVDPGCILNWGDGNNIDIDPCFAEPGYWDSNGTPNDVNDDFWVEGDYHLLAGSPCIDAGDPNYAAEPNETDIDGEPRVMGGRVDIGADEVGLYLDFGMDEFWMYQSLPGQSNSDLTAGVSITDDPMGNTTYSYAWEILLPGDVTLAPVTMDGGGAGDAYWTFAARGCDEPGGLSDSGQTFTVRVTITGDDYGNTGQAEAEFGIALLGDVNNDGIVNVADRAIANAFGRFGSVGSYTLRDCDVNCDGIVNVADRAIANAVGRGLFGQDSVSEPCPMR